MGGGVGRARAERRLSLVLVPGGLVAAVVGALMMASGARRLRRRGVFGAHFWGSLPEFFGYRVRALAPVLMVLFGVGLAAGGLFLLYLGVGDFYGARFGIPGP